MQDFVFGALDYKLITDLSRRLQEVLLPRCKWSDSTRYLLSACMEADAPIAESHRAVLQEIFREIVQLWQDKIKNMTKKKKKVKSR